MVQCAAFCTALILRYQRRGVGRHHVLSFVECFFFLFFFVVHLSLQTRPVNTFNLVIPPKKNISMSMHNDINKNDKRSK